MGNDPPPLSPGRANISHLARERLSEAILQDIKFRSALGSLVISWANNESVFHGMLRALLPSDDLSDAIVWHSLRTSHARLELIVRLCRDRLKKGRLLSDIETAVRHFKGLSKIRNFYCHAVFTYGPSDLHLYAASGITLSQEGDPVRFETKLINAATLNEISVSGDMENWTRGDMRNWTPSD
jgi:hypothetical protein